MRKYLIILMLCFSSAHWCFAQSSPQIFQPGVISKGDYESHPAFTPTGDTLYFIKLSNDLKLSAICVSYKRKSHWTNPEIVKFSGQYMDADPFVSKDGKSLYFMSNRPVKKGDPVKDDTDIWRVDITRHGWGTPQHLEAPLNSTSDEYYPTLADNGDIYFGSTRAEDNLGGSDIYRCHFVNGHYLPAENLGKMINTAGNEFEAFIASDESFIIFNSTPNSLARLDFYISYNEQGLWTKAKKISEPLNSDGIEWSPKMSRDRRLLYFSSTRNTNVQVPAKPENMLLFNKRLHEQGNSLGDIYTVDFNSLKINK